MSLADVQKQILECSSSCGRSAAEVRLIAVSKTKPPEAIEQAYALGQRDFGENYADELLEKAQQLVHLKDLRWVYIGQLQSNKINRIVAHAHEIQTVASEKHARYINRYAEEYGKWQFPIFICVNAGDEAQKQGVTLADLDRLAHFINKECPNLSLQGIMAIPPAKYADSAFADVPDLYKSLRQKARTVGKGKLSLGMSGDLRLAIHAGSDCILIGTAIFGSR